MPPKKKEEETPELGAGRFGRVRNNLRMGLVGLPNVGKSSLFNLFTEQSAAAENFPFCTVRGARMRGPPGAASGARGPAGGDRGADSRAPLRPLSTARACRTRAHARAAPRRSIPTRRAAPSPMSASTTSARCSSRPRRSPPTCT